MLAPYREFVDRPKLQKAGLILAPVLHKCKPPGKFSRFINALFGKRIIQGSLWRCQECYSLRVFMGDCATHYPGWFDDKGLVARHAPLPEGVTLLSKWIDAGGEE